MPWQVQCFPSGTHLVRDTNAPDPHLYVYGPGGEDDSAYEENRYLVCQQLAEFMNGGARPGWLDDLYRVTETHAEALDHTSITATGPSVDIDPPNLDWRQDNSEDAHNARARLMDRLFLNGK